VERTIVYFMSRSEYSSKACRGVAALFLLTVAFPFILAAIVYMTGASAVGGAAGALALVISVFLKPIIYLGATAYLARPSWRRLRSFNFPGLLALAVPLLMLGDIGFGIAFGSFWAVGFSLGILAALPVLLLAALILIALFCFLPDESAVFAEPSGLRTAWLASVYFPPLLVVVYNIESLLLPHIALVVLAVTSFLLFQDKRSVEQQ
jgi:uncharacterized membrane protein YhaH (DUF805 family)